jgi:hypothetical protein
LTPQHFEFIFLERRNVMILTPRFAGAMLALVFLATVQPFASPAATITLSDPDPTYSASAVNCTGTGGPWAACGAIGDLSYGTDITSTSLFNVSGFNTTGTLGEETFASSFAAWTETAAGTGWKLVDGGALDVDYDVTEFQTNASTTGGGVDINVNVSTPEDSDVDLSSLVWSQALLINYLVTDPPGVNQDPPVSAMDTFSFNLGGSAIPSGSTCSPTGAGGKPYCDPAYPFQYADTHFFDGPSGVYPMDSFRGIALLSSVDTTDKILTVYDTGVDYGFDLWVSPEPGTFFLIPASLAAILMLRRRQRKVVAATVVK